MEKKIRKEKKEKGKKKKKRSCFGFFVYCVSHKETRTIET